MTPFRSRVIYRRSSLHYSKRHLHESKFLFRGPCHLPTVPHKRRRQRGLVFPDRWLYHFAISLRIWNHLATSMTQTPLLLH